MFGLLGGLLGGGLLGGKGGGGGGSSMPKYAARAPQSITPPPAPEAEAAPAAPTPTPEPVAQPAEQALSQIAPAQVSKGQPSPVSGLLDTAPPVASPSKMPDAPPIPEQVANRSSTPAPTAPQAEDSFGAIPMLRKTDLLKNQLMDSDNTRIQMPFQSGMPDKHFDTSGSDWTPPMGLSYRQSSTIDQMPGRKYGR